MLDREFREAGARHTSARAPASVDAAWFKGQADQLERILRLQYEGGKLDPRDEDELARHDASRENGGQILYVQATGPADPSEWQSLTMAEREKADISRLLLLADVRRRESLPTGPDARRTGEVLSRWGAVAMVARPGAQYGLGRMVDAATEFGGSPARSFTDLDEARAWLEG